MTHRPVWAEVDLQSIRDNVEQLRAITGVEIMAVVKADGYGHGAVRVARAALDGGAGRLGVALVEEGEELRAAGIDCPIHLLSEPPPGAPRAALEADLVPAVYTEAGIRELDEAAAGLGRRATVHLKVDTGMHRLGAQPDELGRIAMALRVASHLETEGIWTHLAVADEPGNPYTAEQLEKFERAVQKLRSSGVRARLLHAANSAGALAHPAARYDICRVGIATYGLRPAAGFELPDGVWLSPALSWKARVSHVKEVDGGERVSYGLTYTAPSRTRLVTVPVGYADGYSRAFSNRAEVLISGRRHRVAGAVTMDHILVDVGDTPVAPGDEVVLIGRSGDERITAEDAAIWMGSICYEVVSRIGKRVPRVYAE